MSFTVIIPARYASSRLPGKPLIEINGKPLIQHVFESARGSSARAIIIATDDRRIQEAADKFGAHVVLTSAQHLSGTDRIAEAAQSCDLNEDEIIVNVQGDEYGLPPALIDQTASALQNNPGKAIATLCEALTDKARITDSNVVKVVTDNNNNALYFSRSAIPWTAGAGHTGIYRRHIGLYACTVRNLQAFTRLETGPLEKNESLEQLRALYHGWKIHVEEAAEDTGIDINTPADLERINASG